MKSFLKKIIPDALLNAVWHLPRAVGAVLVFGYPAHHIKCVAIAGTKGKTSTAFFLSHILNASGKKTALCSTAEVFDGKKRMVNVWKMTTPDVFSVQKFLRAAVRNHCTTVVLEVSSHALKQHRVFGIPFSVVTITNLTPDHLEYHASEEEYVMVHEKLFSKDTHAFCVPQGMMDHELGMKNKAKRIAIENLKIDITNLKSEHWWMPLQQKNIAAAQCTARTLGITEEEIIRALKTLPCPPGRFESIDTDQEFRVVVDYAHSPESLEYFFSTIQPLVSGKLIVVFGACGDRDKNQRPTMGAILKKYADVIILTTDDPYSENPSDIADDVERGLSHHPDQNDAFQTLHDSQDSCDTAKSSVSTRSAVPQNDVTRILDRKEAIAYAISIAKKNDCVCILGKGAEQWQIFKNKKIPWDDREITSHLLTQKKA